MSYPKILLMRHGETEWNVLGRTQGVLNSPLTANGRAQAEQLGRILFREIGSASGFDQYVSPLGRTLETAEGIKKHFDLAPIEDDRIQEINLGKIGGMTRFEVENEMPEQLEGKKGYEWYYGAPGGETFEQVYARSKSWLNSLKGPTIAVSHGQVGKVIRGIYCGFSKAQMLVLGEPQGVVHVLENGQETIWRETADA
ncbi:histidine phosphatase family protein [uncultured Maritalea sp.]|uniref:histidine phosphatase family protein n=1 Tax=uncultured Maritalea sp. TaxID=757249 RepID=UPI00262D699A|nr:histidine phosphatase family protein [uncultured Maritalea sp.]